MSESFYKTALFNRLLEGKLSAQDIDELITWLGKKDLDPEAAELIMQQLKQPVSAEQTDPALIAALEKRLPQILQSDKRNISLRATSISNNWLRYAAAIIVLFGLGVLFFIYRKPAKQPPVVSNTSPVQHDILPGKEGAVLTLADGRKVVLDSLGHGIIATQNGSRVVLKNGQLAYEKEGGANNVTDVAIGYNMMTTPRGRQFQLLLPDGSKVWLNAASSIRYPTVFTGEERRVEITGEAYFEVAKNAAMPFRVVVNDKATIEVLGTHFNVNSYQNEASVNTTLLEGSVRIVSNDKKAVLVPGQQAQINIQSSAPGIRIVKDVDVEKVMAWKNGVFNFQDATLEEVMRQLERWYDIEVIYEQGVPKLEFIGKMGRDLKLSEVLRGLEVSNVHFRLEGRKLIVLQ